MELRTRVVSCLQEVLIHCIDYVSRIGRLEPESTSTSFTRSDHNENAFTGSATCYHAHCICFSHYCNRFATLE